MKYTIPVLPLIVVAIATTACQPPAISNGQDGAIEQQQREDLAIESLQEAIREEVAEQLANQAHGREIVLADEEGRPRIRLDAGGETSSPRIVIYNKNNQPQLELFVNELGSMVTLYDPSGRPRVVLDAADDMSQIGLQNSEGGTVWNQVDQ